MAGRREGRHAQFDRGRHASRWGRLGRRQRCFGACCHSPPSHAGTTVGCHVMVPDTPHREGLQVQRHLGHFAARRGRHRAQLHGRKRRELRRCTSGCPGRCNRDSGGGACSQWWWRWRNACRRESRCGELSRACSEEGGASSASFADSSNLLRRAGDPLAGGCTYSTGLPWRLSSHRPRAQQPRRVARSPGRDLETGVVIFAGVHRPALGRPNILAADFDTTRTSGPLGFEAIRCGLAVATSRQCSLSIAGCRCPSLDARCA